MSSKTNSQFLTASMTELISVWENLRRERGEVCREDTSEGRPRADPLPRGGRQRADPLPRGDQGMRGEPRAAAPRWCPHGRPRLAHGADSPRGLYLTVYPLSHHDTDTLHLCSAGARVSYLVLRRQVFPDRNQWVHVHLPLSNSTP